MRKHGSRFTNGQLRTIERYTAQGYAAKDIAELLNCSTRVVLMTAKRLGFERPEKMLSKVCQCGCRRQIYKKPTMSWPRWERQKYHSHACASRATAAGVNGRRSAANQKLLASLGTRHCSDCQAELVQKKWEAVADFARRTSCHTHQCNHRSRPERKAKPKPPERIAMPPVKKYPYACKQHGNGVSRTGACLLCSGGQKTTPPGYRKGPKNNIAPSFVDYGALNG